jgi:hypothetical protein
MRVAILLVTAVLAVGVLWLAGEEHRRNCIASGNSECSVLPWDNGQAPSVSESGGRLTPRGCQQLRRDNLLALTEGQKTPLPPECQ